VGAEAGVRASGLGEGVGGVGVAVVPRGGLVFVGGLLLVVERFEPFGGWAGHRGLLWYERDRGATRIRLGWPLFMRGCGATRGARRGRGSEERRVGTSVEVDGSGVTW